MKPMSPANGKVLAAAAAIIILAGLLVVRLAALDGEPPAPPTGHVPAPLACNLDQLQVPQWWLSEAKSWSLEFKTDLDMLAPLGTGSENAAIWFKDFTKNSGARYDEAKAAMERRIDHPRQRKVLPADDPLLVEAEPWCDQATMRFYPEIFPYDGWETLIPNLLVPVTFARSWVARGLESNDREAAMNDFRRAIRLGRLLRQEGVTVIADLVALACIRIGAEGMYEAAMSWGDRDLALLSAVVLGEVAPQRLLVSERLTRSDLSPYLHRTESGEFTLDLPDSRLQTMLEMVESDPNRSFRHEALVGLNVVRFLGTEAQQQRVLEVLDELAGSDDEAIASLASYAREKEPTEELLAGTLKR